MTETEPFPSAHAELFSAFPEQARKPGNRARFLGLSAAVHALFLVAVVLLPLLLPDDAPPPVDYIKALIYNPPPPPPPPLPRGASTRPTERAPEKTGAKPPDPDVLVEPKLPDPKPLEPEKGIDPLKQFGVADGSEAGSLDGMVGGTEGGTVGGTLGGTLGGVLGGTGDSPVIDYDQAPKLLKKTAPVYPQEAFIKKIEGVVTLEIVIGVDGRVGRTRILRSIPQLDAAAILTVRQWLFSPAIKDGRPVPTLATAPVSFRIY